MDLIAGLCVIEDVGIAEEVAQELKRQIAGLPVRFYFKASFDKANRTSISSFRGPGLEKGLKILSKIKENYDLQICTDFHQPQQAEAVAAVADFIQIPAFLCRQTDMIVTGVNAVLRHQRRLNIKKGQFLAPWDAKNIIEKVETTKDEFIKSNNRSTSSDDWFCITERGTSFGYNTLVVDMISFQTIKSYGVSVIYDATHSIQVPGAAPGGKSTGGKPEYLEPLTKAAIAAGADGLFIECHPDPKKAKSDGPNALPLEHVGTLVRQVLEIRDVVNKQTQILQFPSQK